MPTCCSQNYDGIFNAKTAARELRAYQRRGPKGATRRVLDLIRSRDIDGCSVLDIGGGVGVLQHELADAGATEIYGVDASAPYLNVASTEAKRRGYGDRHRTLAGDFVDVAHRLEPADIVSLDKVICCYPDMQRLVSTSVSKARRIYAVVVPRDGVLMRAAFSVMNAALWLLRVQFRGFVHRHREIDQAVSDSGFRIARVSDGVLWSARLYERDEV